MNPKTLIIGFVPESKKETSVTLRNKTYAEDILASYDLGEIVTCTNETYSEPLNTCDPYVIITTSDYLAHQIKDVKSDTHVYVTDSANSIFSRKAEVEKKKEEQKKIFKAAEEDIQKFRESSEEERKELRKFAAMSYDDVYKMLTKAFISEDKDVSQKAREILFGEGERHPNIIWMRVRMMAEVWEHADCETREKLMCMSMERHINQGTARKIENYTDEQGQSYHQYIFLDPFGKDMEHVRRLPFGTKKQDKYEYERLLEQNEIPTNYLRLQLEANSVRQEWDKHIKNECEKVKKVLEEWEKDPTKSKKELGVVPWDEYDDVSNPLTERELKSLRNFLKKYLIKLNKNNKEI